MKILVAGYPYVRESFLKTFEGPDYVSLLPRIWKAKDGRVVFHPPQRSNVIPTAALFYHSNYPIIGGVLKGWMPAFPGWLWKFRNEIDLVYTPLEPILLSTLYQGIWSKLFGKKHVLFTWENVPYSKFRGFNRLIKIVLLRLNLTLCDGIVCGNQKAQEIICQYTKKPTSVIPLAGLDTEFFKPKDKYKAKESLGLSHKLIFAFVGAIDYRKGLHLAISAFAELIKKHPNAHFIIAGSGNYEKEIRRMITHNRLADHITIQPWVNQVEGRTILDAADVFIYPSISHGGWEEQFGYSIAEAMLMELPVISTNTGSIADLIRNGDNGILVKSNDSPALREAMDLLAGNPEKRKQFGVKGRELICNQFSHQIVRAAYQKFFHEIISQ